MSFDTLLERYFEVVNKVVWIGMKRSSLRMEIWSFWKVTF